ncbi:MAG: penicillin-binding protein activator [Pseudomonadota bacterium]
MTRAQYILSTPPFGSLVRVLTLALVLSACAYTPPPPPQTAEPAPPVAPPEPVPAGPVKIAFLAPLTGGAELIGQDLLAAAELALFSRPGDIMLLPRDTMGTPQGAEAAVRDAIAEGAEIIVGPLFSAAAAAIGPIAAEDGLKVLAFSNDATVARPDLFVLGFRPEEQVERVVAFARSRGLTRIAALAPDNAYGMRAMAAWRDAGPETPANPAILPEQPPRALAYPTEISDLSGYIRDFTRYDARLREARAELPLDADPDTAAIEAVPFEDAQAILIADGGAHLRAIAALMAFYDVRPGDVQLLGTDLWREDRNALREPALQGGWFASTDPLNEERFDARFRQSFGRKPHELAGLAFDAVTLAILAAGIDRTMPTSLLTSPSGYQGVTGIFRLRPDGLTDHGLAILQVDGTRLQVIDPMPVEFRLDLTQ